MGTTGCSGSDRISEVSASEFAVLGTFCLHSTTQSGLMLVSIPGGALYHHS